MSLRVTILGCGSSGGVPRIGKAGWGACDPNEPRNRRRRCSILVQKITDQGELTTVLVDMSPDLRMQLLDANVVRLDAVLMTHPHADHLHGIDDIRPLVIDEHRRMNVFMDHATSKVARTAFGYIFQTPPGSLYPPLVDESRLERGNPANITGAGGTITAMPFGLHHGEIDALGFRFGNVAYTPDVKSIPNESLEHLQNLDVWIIDALRPKPHPSHFSLADALHWVERMKPKKAILTNLHNDMDYASLRSTLPPHIMPAYDGMQIDAG